MSKQVFCKNCIHLEYEIPDSNIFPYCNHPNGVTIKTYSDPIKGIRTTINYPDPIVKNQNLNCPDYTEKSSVKNWNKIKSFFNRK